MNDKETLLLQLEVVETNIDRWSIFHALPPVSDLESTVLLVILANAEDFYECLDVLAHTDEERVQQLAFLAAYKFVTKRDELCNLISNAPQGMERLILSMQEVMILNKIELDDLSNNYVIHTLCPKITDRRLREFALQCVLINDPTYYEVFEVFKHSHDMPVVNERAQRLLFVLDTPNEYTQ